MVEKAIHGFFNIVIRTPLARIPRQLLAVSQVLAHTLKIDWLRGIWTSCPAAWFSNDSHFPWL